MVVTEALKEMGIRVNTGLAKAGASGYLGEGLLGKLKRLPDSKKTPAQINHSRSTPPKGVRDLA